MGRNRPRVITGRVRDAHGAPLPNARVYFVRGPGDLPDVAAITDTRGLFTLTAPTPGEYEIECMTDEAGSARQRVEVQNDDLQVELSPGKS
jgi:hypothetical protein